MIFVEPVRAFTGPKSFGLISPVRWVRIIAAKVISVVDASKETELQPFATRQLMSPSVPIRSNSFSYGVLKDVRDQVPIRMHLVKKL
jgi:hypothetical protein